MPNKTKKGKHRKDKFYHLAKETGYRARSAFKLIQLDRKLRLLESTRVAIDLCAAPGGWLQVLQNCMPVSSVIIGVDLVPIKPIPNVITIMDDITTDSCASAISRHLQSWKADIVLNDGAPNVGQSWAQDAFTQSQLTLAAFKLAAKFLAKGGCFVTKIFRSKDYLALNWAFKQLFVKVKATKPQASRNESAEIYVICQNFKAPDKIDPKFFDIKHVFKDMADPDSASAAPDKLLVGQPITKQNKPKAMGYEENTLSVYKPVPVSTFLKEENFIPILNSCSELRLDMPEVAEHDLTVPEIQEFCKDVQLLGKKDVKTLLKWRAKMRTDFAVKLEITGEINKEPVHSDQAPPLTEEEKEAQLEEYLAKADKKRKAKLREQKIKLRQKMALGATALIEEDDTLFSLGQMKSKKQFDAYEGGVDDDNTPQVDLEDLEVEKSAKMFDRAKQDHSKRNEWMKDLYSDDESSGSSSDSEIDLEDEDQTGAAVELAPQPNPLLATGSQTLTANERAKQWYASHEVFSEMNLKDNANLDFSDDEIDVKSKKKDKTNNKQLAEKQVDPEKLKAETAAATKKARSIAELVSGKSNKRKQVSFESELSDDENDDDIGNKDENASSDDSLTESETETDVGSLTKNQMLKRKLTPEQLALGHEIAFSAKRRREIIEKGFHRFTYHDENELPKWFKHEEDRHTKPIIPVSKEIVQMYKERLKEINSRPIKKVAEAKARKKAKTMKKLENIKGKAEKIANTQGASEREKLLQIKGLYKKAKVDKKYNKEKTYIVTKKKGTKAVNPSKKKSKKGPVKFVDRRLKADKYNTKQKAKNEKKGKKTKSVKPQKVNKMRHMRKNKKH